MKDIPFYHTAIIGAGASGLFCAGSFDATKIILEANEKPAQKVAISGGGKCNFSNRSVSASNYVSQNKHFCKNALAAFKPTDFTALLDEAHIPWHEKENGQLVGKKSSDIVKFLVTRAQAHHTKLALNTRVLNVQKNANGFFLLSTSSGPIQAQHVVLASGGLSYPTLGANPFGLKMARQFDLSIEQQRPVLCGLNAPKDLRPLCQTLTGNSVSVVIRQGKHTFEDFLLFTHEGISGPAVLQLSVFWEPNIPVEIDFLPHQEVAKMIATYKHSTQLLSTLFTPPLSHHATKTLLSACDGPLASLSRAQIHTAIQTLHHFQFSATGTFGYTKAEATAGGISTREINPSTFEVRRIPGLFVIGELIDVTGNLGGFNLHWAWASGFCAAQTLQKRF